MSAALCEFQKFVLRYLTNRTDDADIAVFAVTKVLSICPPTVQCHDAEVFEWIGFYGRVDPGSA